MRLPRPPAPSQPVSAQGESDRRRYSRVAFAATLPSHVDARPRRRNSNPRAAAGVAAALVLSYGEVVRLGWGSTGQRRESPLPLASPHAR